MTGVRPDQRDLTEDEIRQLFRQTREPQAKAERPPLAVGGQEFTEDQIRSMFRRDRLRTMLGREPSVQGLVPPITEPFEARPPGAPPTPEPQPEPPEPTARAPQPLDPRAAQAFAAERAVFGVPTPEEAAQRRARGVVARRAAGAAIGDMMQRVRETLGLAQPETPFGPLVRPVPPEGEFQADVSTQPDPFRSDTRELLQTIGADLTPDNIRRAERVRRNFIVQHQRELAGRNLPSRLAFSLGFGTIRFGEALLHPIDPSRRNITQKLELIQSGGGLVAPLDERRNVLATLGVGMAEYVPTLVALQAAGVLGATARMTAGTRAAIVGALEEKFGKRAAIRIFEEALKESAEEGLSVALFESVVGRGAGRDLQGRLTVFGEEVLAETGGFALGAAFGTFRGVFRELARAAEKGEWTRRVIDTGIQNPNQLQAAVEAVAKDEGVSPEFVAERIGEEGARTVGDNLIRFFRGATQEGGTLPEILAERADVQRQQALQARESQIAEFQFEQDRLRRAQEAAAARQAEEALRPAREFAADLAANPTVRELGALRALRRRFPDLDNDTASQLIAEAFGTPTGAPPVDISGRPIEEPTPEPTPEEVEAARIQEREGRQRERADISSRLAALEVSAERRIRQLTEPETEVHPQTSTLEQLQDSIEELVNRAASAGENALVDRAARLAARVRDAIENPPEPPRAAKPEAVEPEPSPTPERAPEGGEAVAAPPEVRPPEPEPPKAETPRETEVEPTPGRLPPAERLAPQQRRLAEEIFGEDAARLSDEELAEELAGLGITPETVRETPSGRRITDLTNEQLVDRIEAAGLEVPEAGPDYRERLLAVVDPEGAERLAALEQERRQLRGRLAGEIRGRRQAQREADIDEKTGLGSQNAFVRPGGPKARAEADPNTSFVELDVRNLKAANESPGGEAEGDRLLLAAARAVRQAAEEAGVSPRSVFRTGGDEFVVLAPNNLAEQIRDRAVEIMGDVPIEGTEFRGGLRGGIGDTANAASQAVGAAKKGETGRFRPTGAPEPAAPAPAPGARDAMVEFLTVDRNFSVEQVDDAIGRVQGGAGLSEALGAAGLPITREVMEMLEAASGVRVGARPAQPPPRETLEPSGPKETRTSPTFEQIREDRATDVIGVVEPGATDQLLVERPDGRTDRLQVEYDIIEADEVRESHKVRGTKVERNPDFPEEVQPRARFDPEFVAARATEAAFDPEQLVLRTPTAERGPPIIQENGIVLGGNNRVAILRRVYDDDGPAARRYRDELVKRADEFGLTPEQIADFDRPILVRRVLDGPETGTAARELADDLNRTAVRSRTSAEEATLAAQRITEPTLAFFDEHFPVDGTLRAFLNSPDGVEFVRRLRDEGAISADQQNRFFNRQGQLNPEGRDFIENMVLGRAVGSAEVLDVMPAALRGKLAKSAPIIAGLKGDFDIQPALQEAIQALAEAQRAGTPARLFLTQGELGLGGPTFSAPAKQLALFLDETKTQKGVVEGFRKFKSAAEASPTGQGELIPTATLSPRRAFQQAFGDTLLQGEAGALEFAEPGPVTPPDKPRLQLTPERIKALKERGVDITPEKQAENLAAFRRRSEERRRRKEARRGPTKETQVQPRGKGERPPEPTPPQGEPGPGESGGGRAGDETRDIDPEGEPGVARGQRRREKDRQKVKDRQAARKRALEEETKRFNEARIDADDLADIKKVRESVRAGLRAAADAGGIQPKLVDDQLKDISRIQTNLLDIEREQGAPAPAFLVGNSPGTGKTFVGAGVIAEVIERAKEQGRPGRVLVVVPGKADGPIVQQWQQAARTAFDLEMKPFVFNETLPDENGIFTVSATGLGNQFDPNTNGLKVDFGNFDLIVFDEAHLFTNIFSANRAFAARTLRRGHTDRILHLSATPFEFPWDLAYLENLRLWGPGRAIRSFDEWLANHGVRKSTEGDFYYFVKSKKEDVLRVLTQIRREMIEAGIYTQRAIEVDKKLQNDFVEVKLSETYGTYYDAVMDEIAELLMRAKGVEIPLLKAARVIFTRRISELAKIPKAVELTRRFLEQNRSVVVFTGYKMDFKLADRTAERFPTLAAVVNGINTEMREGVQRLVRELGGEDVVAQIHGGRTGGQRSKDLAAFLGKQKRVMVATVDAGGTGLSLHDTVGDAPRAQINLTLPWTGKTAEQLAGRTYRVGTKTDTQMIWMGMDTPVERSIMRRVAMKWQAMGALVQGRVEHDAVKLEEFNLLPEAELQQHLFGEKKAQGIDPEATELDFVGRPNELSPREAESLARIRQAQQDFHLALAGTAKPSGLDLVGKHPDPAALRDDLELPRHNRDILKESQIIGKAARKFAVRAFLGGIKSKRVLGRFHIVADLMRLRSAQDVRVASHELGHHIDKLFFGFLKHPKAIAPKIPTHLLQFVDELKPMAYKGAKDKPTEGFAEFVAGYVTAPTVTMARAPAFFKYFRDHLNRVSPKDLATLDWMQQQYSLFKTFPPAERIGSRMIIGDSGELDHITMNVGRRFKKWYHNWLDHQAIFKDMDRMMAREDPKWRSLQMMARRVFGAEPLAHNAMLHGIPDFVQLTEGNRMVRRSKGLEEIFEPIDTREKFDLFRYWAAARRAIELSSRGFETGMDDLIEDGTVSALLSQIQRSDFSKVFAETWEGLQRYQDALLEWLVASENLTPAQVLAMRKMNLYYVPWHRLMSEPDHLMDWVAESKRAKSQGRTVDGMVGLPPPIHRLKGSSRPIIDPIESIVGNTRFFIQLGFRKQVENGVAKFADRVFGAEGHGKFIQQIDPKLVASRFSVRQIRDALRNLGIRMEDVSDEQLGQLVTLFSPMTKRKDLPVFTAIVDGKRRWYQINDPETWDAMAGLNPVEFGLLTKLAIASKAVLRTGVVVSPEFMARNFLRDAQTAWIQAPFRGRGVAGAARKIPMTAAVEGLAHAIGGGKLWDEFVGSGAAGAGLSQISRQTNQFYMRQLFGRKALSRHLSATHSIPDNVREITRMLRDLGAGSLYKLTQVSSVFENANRLSTWKAAREEGADFLHAGFAAREVSTDFAVHGAKLAAWRLTTAFLNPSAQGMARTFRAFRDRPLLTLARSSMLTLSSAALWWYNRQDPDYPEYSRNLKARFWIFRSPSSGTVWRFPKAYIYGDVFGSFLAEAFLDWAVDRDPEIVTRLGTVLKQAFGFTMVPTILLPALEIALNKSLYFDTPIESQSMRDNLPTEFRSREYTSESSKRLSEALARFAETADTNGLGRIGRFINRLNLSPVQYDHLVRGYFGTLGFDLWNDVPFLIKLGKNGVRKLRDLEPLPFTPNERLRNHMFFRAFTVAFPSQSAESIRRFYDRRDVLNEVALRYEALQSLADETDSETSAEALTAQTFFENHLEEILLAPLYETVAAGLSVLARQRATAETSEEVDQYNRRALEMARDALASVGDMSDTERRLMEQRTRERRFGRLEDARLQSIRDRLDVLVLRRQLLGGTTPTQDELDQARAIINSAPGLTGSQRGALRRHYNSIRRGTLVEREFAKTPRTVRKRFLREQRRQLEERRKENR